MRKLLILLWMGLLTALTATAYDFEEVNSDGVPIYYLIKSDGLSVEVTYKTYHSSQNYSGVVDIPESATYNGIIYPVTRIHESAFASCTDLEGVKIPSTVTAIGPNAFYKCTSLTSIDIPDQVSYVGMNAFNGCTGLASVKLPASLRLVCYETFKGCSALTEIVIPEGVTSIGHDAFMNCTTLVKVDLPASVTDIEPSAFVGCKSLKSVTVRNLNPANIGLGYLIFDGVDLSGSVLYVPGVAVDLYATAPQWKNFGSIEPISSYYDFVAKNEADVDIYYKINGDNVAVACQDAQTQTYAGAVSIPSSVAFGGRMFNVTAIGGSAFRLCSDLKSVKLPASITSIGSNAFRGCTKLHSMTVAAVDPASIQMGTDVFTHSDIGYGTLYVPRGGKALYEATEPWSGFGTINQGSYDFAAANADGVTIYYAINDDRNSVSVAPQLEGGFVDSYMGVVNIPTSVTNDGVTYAVTAIADYAFKDCNMVTAVTIPESVTAIGQAAFSGCSSLRRLTIPAFVTAISDEAFAECTDMTAVVLPSTIKTIGARAFYGCTHLQSINFPQGLTSIGASAFQGCSSLYKLTIPTSVNNIGASAFADCSALYYLTVKSAFPSSITLGDGVFASTASHTFLYVPRGSITLYGQAPQWMDFCSIAEVPYDFAEVNDDGQTIYYSINPDGKSVTVTYYDSYVASYEGSLVIPASVTHDGVTYTVTAVGANAFSYCGELLTVTLPATVTSIGERAFEGCNALVAVEIPAAIASIGECAFFGCSNLRSVILYNPNPASITLGDNIFLDVTLGHVTLFVPRGAAELYAEAPQWGALGSIIAPTYDFAEANADGVLIYYIINDEGTSVTVAPRDNKYNSYADTVVIPAEVSHAGVTYAVIAIGNRAFYDSSALTAVSIPESVTSIGDSAFGLCYGMTSLTVEQTDPSAFTLGADIFAGDTEGAYCVAGSTLYVPKDCADTYAAADQWRQFGRILAPVYDFDAPNEDGRPLYYEVLPVRSASAALTCAYEGTELYQSYSGTVIIPEFVTLDGVNYSVTAIAASAFKDCTSLTSVTVPASINAIGDGAFSGCQDLQSLKVYVSDPADIELGQDVFSGVPTATLSHAPCTLYVPHGSKELYAAAPQWQAFTDIVEFDIPGALPESAITDGTEADPVYYDLQGRRVLRPTTGIYIVGGRKVLIK